MNEAYYFNREAVERQTLQNLIEAGIIEPDKAQGALLGMRDLDPKDMLAVLLESHLLREAAEKVVRYFPIDYACISMN